MKKLLPIILIALTACSQGWTAWEREVIGRQDSLMYVTTIGADSAILRTVSIPVPPELLKSRELKDLTGKMLYTVEHPSQDGVGIAAPQVGINRRIAWVMRYDKPGKPFECFVNLQIDSLWGEMTHGPEGCLSVPPMRGLVPRYSNVKISYTDLQTGKTASEEVEGYTAIIFQHECDHLDATLYIDRADTVFVSEDWARERETFSYDKPSWWK